jgi:hypothetical protein
MQVLPAANLLRTTEIDRGGRDGSSWPRDEVWVETAADGRSWMLALGGERVTVFPPNLRGGAETLALVEFLIVGYSRR